MAFPQPVRSFLISQGSKVTHLDPIQPKNLVRLHMFPIFSELVQERTHPIQFKNLPPSLRRQLFSSRMRLSLLKVVPNRQLGLPAPSPINKPNISGFLE